MLWLHLKTSLGGKGYILQVKNKQEGTCGS